MSQQLFSPVRSLSADEAPALGTLLAQALHFGPDPGRERWMAEVVGHENFLVLHRDGRLAAGLAVLPMGQSFGGRFVSTGGICCVGVAPEARGTGAGFALMKGMLGRLKEQGVALSTLFPSTTAFYRKLGYERAGVRADWRISLGEILIRGGEPEIRPMEAEDEAAVRSLQESWALRHEGNLRRHEGFMWTRWLSPVDQGKPSSPIHRYVVEDGGRIRAYVFYRQGEQFQPMNVIDWAAADPASARRLWSFFAAHATMATELRWRGGFPDVMADFLPEQKARCHGSIDWMLRIVDLPAALEARGYDTNLETSLLLEVEDEVLPWNHGRFAFGVAEGRGRCRILDPVSSSGKPPLRLNVRAFAALFAGRASVEALHWAGLLEGLEEDRGRLQSCFPRSAPWMADSF